MPSAQQLSNTGFKSYIEACRADRIIPGSQVSVMHNSEGAVYTVGTAPYYRLTKQSRAFGESPDANPEELIGDDGRWTLQRKGAVPNERSPYPSIRW